MDGTILKMEFLHPLEDDDRTVILLLIVSKNSRTKMLWYEWSTEEDFRSQLKPTANLLPPEEQVPLLLIPLKMYTAFILVCEHRITLYKDILTGSLHRIHHRLATVQDPQEPGSSKALPTWVQWARPTRSKHATVQDCVYLCREDGVVQYVVIDDRIDQMIDSTHQAGKLGINIDTSFATLDLGPNTDDLLVTGGAMSEGGLWSFAPREDAKHRAVVPNWSPLNDITAVNITAIKTNRTRLGTGAGKEARGQHRLYTCSGRGKHGAVSELHYGVHTANRYATLDLKAQLDMDVLGIWALHGFYGDAEGQGTVEERSKDVTYVVFSHPLRTSLLRMGLERDPKLGLTCDPGPVHEDVGIDLSCRTIVIGSTRDGITIQITETSLQATRLPMNFKIKEEGDEERNLEQKELENTARQTRYVFSFAGPRALTACIHSTKEDTFILLAMQQDENYYLQFGTFTAPAGYIPSERRIKLRTQPSYLTVLQTENLLLALVGTPECKLEVYLTDGKGASVGNPCSYDFTAPYGICDSIAIINVAGIQSGSTILCGLRNGKVQTLNLMRTQASCQSCPFKIIRSMQRS